jgi:hypothetical protein
MLSRRTRAWSVVSTGVLPRLTTCFGPRTAWAGLTGEHAARDEPIEAHADGSEVLLHRRLGHPGAERLAIGDDVERLDVGELADLVALDPGEELRHGPVIGLPVFRLRMVAAKNSRNRRAAWSPAPAMVAGTAMPRGALRAVWAVESGRADSCG